MLETFKNNPREVTTDEVGSRPKGFGQRSKNKSEGGYEKRWFLTRLAKKSKKEKLRCTVKECRQGVGKVTEGIRPKKISM